ncbi:hypothetical protein ANAPRD1_01399 [Anaplasma phagocytophilum]|nr:hypothetical protein ANAPRD1_01399 [Anaplasma phagocytophilum]
MGSGGSFPPLGSGDERSHKKSPSWPSMSHGPQYEQRAVCRCRPVTRYPRLGVTIGLLPCTLALLSGTADAAVEYLWSTLFETVAPKRRREELTEEFV